MTSFPLCIMFSVCNSKITCVYPCPYLYLCLPCPFHDPCLCFVDDWNIGIRILKSTLHYLPSCKLNILVNSTELVSAKKNIRGWMNSGLTSLHQVICIRVCLNSHPKVWRSLESNSRPLDWWSSALYYHRSCFFSFIIWGYTTMVKLNFLDKYDHRLQSITLIHSVFQVIINLIGSITALKVSFTFLWQKM